VTYTAAPGLTERSNIADVFGKDHGHVLRDIRNLECSPSFRDVNFDVFKINDLTGESTSHVEMTRDGFTFLAIGFTGAKAAEWKEEYIAAFNAMEAELAVRADRAPIGIDPNIAALASAVAQLVPVIMETRGETQKVARRRVPAPLSRSGRPTPLKPVLSGMAISSASSSARMPRRWQKISSELGFISLNLLRRSSAASARNDP
jgi:Rha family phage regulatory protein